MKRNVRNAVVLLAVGGVVTVVACSFPPITFKDTGGTGGTGGATEASSSAGTGAAPTSTGSHTTSASASASGTSSSGTSSSASGSSSGSSSSSSSTAASSSGTSDAGCKTDSDGDGYVSWMCDADVATQDCADEDPNAHPGAGFSPVPITGTVKPGTASFDFNCDGVVTQQTPDSCAGQCNTGVQVFNATVACGQLGALGTCNILCMWTAANPAVMKPQSCK